MPSSPENLSVYIYGDQVDAFCDAVDPSGIMQYKQIFEVYGNRINAKYDYDSERLIFDTELDKFAFLLKYTK